MNNLLTIFVSAPCLLCLGWMKSVILGLWPWAKNKTTAPPSVGEMQEMYTTRFEEEDYRGGLGPQSKKIFLMSSDYS